MNDSPTSDNDEEATTVAGDIPPKVQQQTSLGGSRSSLRPKGKKDVAGSDIDNNDDDNDVGDGVEAETNSSSTNNPDNNGNGPTITANNAKKHGVVGLDPDDELDLNDDIEEEHNVSNRNFDYKTSDAEMDMRTTIRRLPIADDCGGTDDERVFDDHDDQSINEHTDADIDGDSAATAVRRRQQRMSALGQRRSTATACNDAETAATVGADRRRAADSADNRRRHRCNDDDVAGDDDGDENNGDVKDFEAKDENRDDDEDEDDEVDVLNDRRRARSIPRDLLIERRRRSSSSDPVNLSLGMRDRIVVDAALVTAGEDSNDGHIDVETIGTAPRKVCLFFICLFEGGE